MQAFFRPLVNHGYDDYSRSKATPKLCLGQQMGCLLSKKQPFLATPLIVAL